MASRLRLMAIIKEKSLLMKFLTVCQHIMYNIHCVICTQRLILLFDKIELAEGGIIDVRNKSWRK